MEVNDLTAFVYREQQARFFEALPYCSYVVIQPASFNAEASTGLDVVKADANFVAAMICRVDQTSREDPSSAVVVALVGTAQQQYLRSARRIAHHNEGRRNPWIDAVGLHDSYLLFTYMDE